MKRNGAGLASICILSTMVLVIISSTFCLFVGVEDIIKKRYPHEIAIELSSDSENSRTAMQNVIDTETRQQNLEVKNKLSYHYLSIGGFLEDKSLIFDLNKSKSVKNSTLYQNIRQIFFIPLEDYNKTMKTNESLESDEIIIYTPKTKYEESTMDIQGYGQKKIKKHLDSLSKSGFDTAMSISSIFIIIPSNEDFISLYQFQKSIYKKRCSEIIFYYGFDLKCSGELQEKISDNIDKKMQKLQKNDKNFPRYSIDCRETEQSFFYVLYNGLFFIGIILGIVFLLAAVLLIYYKQITEGYEDQDRFAILQKVGMTQKEVRKSINSQVMTVFFLPLIGAGLHTTVAFHIITKLLELLMLENTHLFALSSVGCFLVFAVVYILVYHATSKMYYQIVKNKV